MTVQCSFTKLVEAYAMPDKRVKTLVGTSRQLGYQYGAPDVIHIDQGRNRESRLFSELC